MGINLSKGQKINLSKESGGSLNKIRVGLGWDAVGPAEGGGFFKKLFAGGAPDIDCDASVLMLDGNGKLANISDLIYYGNLKGGGGAVVHTGDNLTGEGEGDDEVILVDLGKVPDSYGKMVFVVNIYGAQSKGQHFGMIKNAFIRVVDESKKSELCKYALSEDYNNQTALIVAEFSRGGDGWDFSALGEGTTDPDLGVMAGRYK